MKAFLSAIAAVLAFASLSLFAPAQAQVAGQCALVNGVMNKVLGPSNVPGQFLARDIRMQQGSGQSWSPDKLQIVPCPGAKVAKNVCFAQEPDSDGKSQLEQMVRGAIRESFEHHAEPSVTRFHSVVVGTQRPATTAEQVDFGDGDFSRGVVDATIDFDGCWDDDQTIRVTHYNRHFLCFIAKSTQRFFCGALSTVDVTDSTTKQYDKY